MHPIHTREIVIRFQPQMTGAILDLGAGQAKYKTLIAPHGSSYTTFDVVPGPAIDVVGDIHALPFADASFDTVICTQVFEHIARPWIVAQEIARILRPGGQALVTMPFMAAFHADPHDYFRYTPEGIHSLFALPGLTVSEAKGYGGWTVVLAESLRFTFLNPYHTQPHHKAKAKVVQVITKMLSAIGRRRAPGAIYSNVYGIIRKQP